MRNLIRSAFICLAVSLPLTDSLAITNGVVMIATRKNQDSVVSMEYNSEERGPGIATPGDVAMASLLSDHGYSCRLILDVMLGPSGAELYNFVPAAVILDPINPDLKIGLAIFSGSSASADVAPPPPGIPVMMGEHVCLGTNAGRVGSLYMYNSTASNDPNEASNPPATKYMKVVAPNHPIMQGIPLDAQGRVKIFREAYPEEAAHLPVGGKKNYEYRWCTTEAAAAAPGTTVLGVLDGAEDRACFAVTAEGGLLANSTTASNRMVHLFTNENGSGGSRRVFLALTELGRVLFVRAAKWAMGEDLEPYQSFRILDVTQPAAARLSLRWQGAAKHNYTIEGSEDGASWKTVVDDVPGGVDGAIERTLDISAAPKSLFLRVKPTP